MPYALAMLVILQTHLMDLFYFAYMLDGMMIFPIPSPHFFAREMYALLGYGSYQLPPEWRGLPFLIGFTGLFAVSISGSGLYTTLQGLGRIKIDNVSR